MASIKDRKRYHHLKKEEASLISDLAEVISYESLGLTEKEALGELYKRKNGGRNL